MRIILTGCNSFIARAFSAELRARQLMHIELTRYAGLSEIVQPNDCIVNFALNPRYRTGPYSAEADCDLRVAQMAAQAGARFVMLSTRRVYPAAVRWNADEAGPATGDESCYGQNKARSEQSILDLYNGKILIIRLSNIFGYEYDPTQGRKSFMGLLLGSLIRKSKIFFDMHPDTKRDFLPVELAVQMVLDRALENITGIYNLGSGFGLPCGRLSDWICEGFGSGELVCDPAIIKDEFFLNMDKWRKTFDLPVNEQTLKDYCVQLGRRLQCEKS